MKYAFIFLLCFLIPGCSSDKVIESDDNIVGEWHGTVEAIYPGPDDRMVTVEGGINFTFYENGRYVFFWSPWVGPCVNAVGTYVWKLDSLFLNQTSPEIYTQPYILKGGFKILKSDSVLNLYQVLHPDIWPESHEVNLTPGHIIFLD